MKPGRRTGSAALAAVPVLSAAAALLIIPPIVLVYLFGHPWPDRLPTHEELQKWNRKPFDAATLLVVVEVILWGAWLWLAGTLCLDLGRLLRRLLARAVHALRRHPSWALHQQWAPTATAPSPVKVIASAVSVVVPATATATMVAPPAAAGTPTLAPDSNTLNTSGGSSAGNHAADTYQAGTADRTGPAQPPWPSPDPAPPGPSSDQLPATDHDPAGTAQRDNGWRLPDGSWITLSTALALVAVWRTAAAASHHPLVPRTVAAVLRRNDRRTDRLAAHRTASNVDRRTSRGTDRSVDRHAGAASSEKRRAGVGTDTATSGAPGTQTSPAVTAAPGPESDNIMAAPLPAGGVGLIGPAATDAARGLLIAALLTRPGAIRIITTATDWTLLAGMTPPPPEVTMTEDLPTALADLERHILAATDRVPPTGSRFHTPPGAQPHPDSQTGAHPPDVADPPDGAATSPLLLIATAPPPTDTARLTIALRQGNAVGAGAVLLGPWPPATWAVDDAGNIDPAPDGPPGPDHPVSPPPEEAHRATRTGSQPRMTVLTVAACADILAMARGHGRDQSTAEAALDSPSDTGGVLREEPPSSDGRNRVVLRRDRVASPRPIPRPLSLRLIGPEHLTTAAGAPVKLPRKAAMDILVLLAVNPRGLNRDAILEAIWPDVRHDSAAVRLHTTISSLRKATDAITAAPIVVRTADRYQLNPAAVDVDLWRLHRHATSARRGPAARSASHWRAVLDLTVPHQAVPHPRNRTTAIQGHTHGVRDSRAVSGPRSTTPDAVPLIAAGQTWPWLLPHRGSLHSIVSDAISHLAK